MFPDWFQPLTWKFNQKALCHACNSVRALPVDDQPVVDLPVSSSSTTVSNLLDSILQSHSVDLDCPRCCRQSHFVHDISVPDHPDKLLLHIRRSSGDIKSRAVVRIPSRIRHFDQHFRFVGAIVHIGDSPDSGHYITVLPPSTSSPGWTCLDDARVYTLATPCSRQWHLYRDATLLLFVLEPSVVPCGVPTLVGSDILSAPSFLVMMSVRMNVPLCVPILRFSSSLPILPAGSRVGRNCYTIMLTLLALASTWCARLI